MNKTTRSTRSAVAALLATAGLVATACGGSSVNVQGPAQPTGEPTAAESPTEAPEPTTEVVTLEPTPLPTTPTEPTPVIEPEATPVPRKVPIGQTQPVDPPSTEASVTVRRVDLAGTTDRWEVAYDAVVVGDRVVVVGADDATDPSGGQANDMAAWVSEDLVTWRQIDHPSITGVDGNEHATEAAFSDGVLIVAGVDLNDTTGFDIAMWRSTDAGESFERIDQSVFGLPTDDFVNDVVPIGSEFLVVGTAIPLDVNAPLEPVIFRSSGGGTEWQRIEPEQLGIEPGSVVRSGVAVDEFTILVGDLGDVSRQAAAWLADDNTTWDRLEGLGDFAVTDIRLVDATATDDLLQIAGATPSLDLVRPTVWLFDAFDWTSVVFDDLGEAQSIGIASNDFTLLLAATDDDDDDDDAGDRLLLWGSNNSGRDWSAGVEAEESELLTAHDAVSLGDDSFLVTGSTIPGADGIVGFSDDAVVWVVEVN